MQPDFASTFSHLVLGVGGPVVSAAEKKMFGRLKPAGIFLTSRNFLHGVGQEEVLKNQEALLADFREATGLSKFFVCLDWEGGRVTHLPATLYPQLPYARAWATHAGVVAELQAKVLQSLGVNFLFGPVVDIDSNWQNPVIGPRAFAADAAAVTAAAGRYCAVFKKHNILTALKHFPGHGDTAGDSHFGLPLLSKSAAELGRSELLPFRQLISEQASDAVMIGHMLAEQIDRELPASLSGPVIDHLLRSDSKFTGLVITDDVAMHALAKHYSFKEIYARHLAANGDLILLAHNVVEKLSDFEPTYARQSLSRIQQRLDRLKTPKTNELSKKELAEIAHAALSNSQPKADNFTLKYTEPSPAQLLPPAEKDFTVKIGVVLAEDDLETIKFTTEQKSRISSGDGSEFELAPGGYQLVYRNLKFYLLQTENQQPVGDFAVPAVLSSIAGVELAVIKLEKLKVGRGFHWAASTDETFSGTLKFTAESGKIVVINRVPFEDYVTAVVGSEMSNTELPPEFAKAQAIAARSWAYLSLSTKYPAHEYDLCNDDMSQRYRGIAELSESVRQAASSTKGQYITDSAGYVIPAYYYKSCGGQTASSADIFGLDNDLVPAVADQAGQAYPKRDLSDESQLEEFLKLPTEEDKQIFCSPLATAAGDFLSAVDVSTDYHRWHYAISGQQIADRVLAVTGKGLSAISDLKILERCRNGRVLRLELLSDQGQTLNLNNQLIIRLCLHQSCLFSSAITITKNGSDFSFAGFGWGHGVGLCQIGAVGMALQGYTYSEILQHYYQSAVITD